jgi:hypothetical protein
MRARRLAHHGEGLGQQRIEGLALRQPAPELVGLGPQLHIVERFATPGSNSAAARHFAVTST